MLSSGLRFVTATVPHPREGGLASERSGWAVPFLSIKRADLVLWDKVVLQNIKNLICISWGQENMHMTNFYFKHILLPTQRPESSFLELCLGLILPSLPSQLPAYQPCTHSLLASWDFRARGLPGISPFCSCFLAAFHSPESLLKCFRHAFSWRTIWMSHLLNSSCHNHSPPLSPTVCCLHMPSTFQRLRLLFQLFLAHFSPQPSIFLAHLEGVLLEMPLG